GGFGRRRYLFTLERVGEARLLHEVGAAVLHEEPRDVFVTLQVFGLERKAHRRLHGLSPSETALRVELKMAGGTDTSYRGRRSEARGQSRPKSNVQSLKSKVQAQPLALDIGLGTLDLRLWTSLSDRCG